MRSGLPDFDTLLEMAQQDPEALENFRRNEVEALITRAPNNLKRRLRGLQFQIDSERQLHPSAMGACVKISCMMHESFAQLRQLLLHLSDPTQPGLAMELATTGREEWEPADILEFRPR